MCEDSFLEPRVGYVCLHIRGQWHAPSTLYGMPHAKGRTKADSELEHQWLTSRADIPLLTAVGTISILCSFLFIRPSQVCLDCSYW
jgi:hypothetical protein